MPSSFPINISANTFSSTMINVSWSTFPEIDHNGILTFYEVQFNQSAELPPSGTVLIPGNTTRVVLTDLEPLVNYTITVRAHTSVGPGPYNPNSVIAQTEVYFHASFSLSCTITLFTVCVLCVAGPVVSFPDNNIVNLGSDLTLECDIVSSDPPLINVSITLNGRLLATGTNEPLEYTVLRPQLN